MQASVAPDYSTARKNMVDRQLRPNGVIDQRLLSAMGEVPRELFVPSTLVGAAYNDESIRLISHRYLLPPRILALLLQAAEINDSDRVLELAPATGYSTIVLSRLSKSVSSVEPDVILHKEAERNAANLSQGHAVVLAGTPIEGCLANAPYDVIFVNGAIEYSPDFLLEQLDEGGRLVAIVRNYCPANETHVGQARLYRKTNGEISCTSLFEASAPLAPGFLYERTFKF